ncbi:MAG: PmoA family protein [Planctomycetes bacterium]|nr:PmoA family protein [Planctomycetota bacterium]
MKIRFLIAVPLLLIASRAVHADANVRVEVIKTGGISIHRPGIEAPIFAFHAPEDGRPYVHPVLAPDGKGVLTEFAPGHHKHQTGIYVGFLKVNGRDFFHNRGGDYFRRRAFEWKNDSQGTRWTSTYDLLDKNKDAQLVETQSWHFRDFTKSYLIDLTLTLKAETDVTFDKHDYGGLFLRMPWKNQKDAKAINSEGDVNGAAEGKKARWVDVGMSVDGRKDAAHIAVMSHVAVPWRVDGQLGVGPSPSRAGAWKIAKGAHVTQRYRFMVYTSDFQQEQVEAESKAFSAIK